MKTEQKFFDCKFLEVKFDDSDDEFFRFEGHAAVFDNIDRGNDVIKRGAFKKTIAALKKNSIEIVGTDMVKLIPILWQHDASKPLGSFVEMREDDKGLFVKGIMPKSDVFVSGTVIPQLRAYSVSDLSIGFKTVEASFENDTRVLEEISLFEASLVTIPMNPEANIISMKAAVPFQDLPLADRTRPWNSGAAIARVRDFTGSKDAPSKTYRNAFLWFDSADADSFGAYKLPIASVIDGKLTAVPRGIFAAAGALLGARGGVDIPDSDRPAVIRNTEKYYDKMGLDSPFKETNSFRIDDFESHNERELESLLKNGVTFSGSMAKRIISALSDKSQRDAGQKSCQRDAELKDELKRLLKSFN